MNDDRGTSGPTWRLLHVIADKAAEAAECAGRQGKFWEMHDAEFKDQAKLDEPNIRALAASVDLDVPSFSACLAGDAGIAIDRDVEAAKAYSLSGTPTFVIGRRDGEAAVRITSRIVGARTIEVFARAIQQASQSTPVGTSSLPK